jgi:riboflavin biosynthesis pyrimidine reductase
MSMRPRVICHMATSIDGRIVTDGWPDSPAIRREYEQIHTMYEEVRSAGRQAGRISP